VTTLSPCFLRFRAPLPLQRCPAQQAKDTEAEGFRMAYGHIAIRSYPTQLLRLVKLGGGLSPSAAAGYGRRVISAESRAFMVKEQLNESRGECSSRCRGSEYDAHQQKFWRS